MNQNQKTAPQHESFFEVRLSVIFHKNCKTRLQYRLLVFALDAKQATEKAKDHAKLYVEKNAIAIQSKTGFDPVIEKINAQVVKTSIVAVI